MIRVAVQYRGRTVYATAATLASAVRTAVGALGLTPGRTVARERLETDHWRWDWSGHALDVRVTSRPGAQTHEERKANGRVRVDVYLSPEAGEKLDELATVAGTKAEAVERAVMAYPTRNEQKDE